MKKILIGSVALALVIVSVALLAGAGQPDPVADSLHRSQASATPAEGRVYPIAAGVWYPGDGPLPERPMRYYRARCWPGCHVGSKFGAFPQTALKDDAPIYPTSTIDNCPQLDANRENR